ncbi:hypothetical protein HanPI659440_Chr14g0564151 [Helianthus annuus]|nr:hypothetical protein HanPI659440_Chr14g0564151 [Helianthus annuus]
MFFFRFGSVFSVIKNSYSKPNRNFRSLKIRKPNLRFLFRLGFLVQFCRLFRLRFGYFGFLLTPRLNP